MVVESDWARAHRLEKSLEKAEKNLDTCSNAFGWLFVMAVVSNIMWFVCTIIPHLRWE